MKRKSLSKALRFEVFKRDSFTCQYCGRSAPDVILNVDHIDAVANGGCSDIINLITSCFDCNNGKNANPLSENAAVKKRKVQLDELQVRREQIEMMAEWQTGLLDLDSVAVDRCADLWKQVVVGYSLNDTGIRNLREYVIKFGMANVMKAIRLSGRYLKADSEGKFTKESVEFSFDKIGGICVLEKRAQTDPELESIYRLRAKLRSRLRYEAGSYRDVELLKSINGLRRLGYTADLLIERLGDIDKWWVLEESIKEMQERAQ